MHKVKRGIPTLIPIDFHILTPVRQMDEGVPSQGESQIGCQSISTGIIFNHLQTKDFHHRDEKMKNPG